MILRGKYSIFFESGPLAGRLLNHRNHTGKRWMSNYFLTTPIYYLNAAPHIGHLYTSLIADAVARYQKLKDHDVEIKFMSGTDEHGLKVRQAATLNGLSEEVYCNGISAKYREMFELFDVRQTDFLRTTEERHKNTVQELWKRVAAKDYIYLSEYSGWYCVSDEAFVSENELAPDPNPDGTRFTLEGYKSVEFVKEVNYKFKLSNFKDDLLHWLRDENVIKPKQFFPLLHSWISNEEFLQDLSVSRPAERIKWGIPVPDDPSQLIYVWFDALSCYLTTAGYPGINFKWPPDLQIIGKDILKFHGVYWPAFLIAAGLDPPKRLLCHSHWVIDGEKMSKSKGNVIDPVQKAATYTSDGFRYFLLREGVPHNNGNYSEEKVIKILNDELANNLGNLLNRCSGALINSEQVFPRFCSERHEFCKNRCADLMNALERLPEEVDQHVEEYNFHHYVDSIFHVLRLTNRMFQDEEPWELQKDSTKRDHLLGVLHMTMESLRVCGILLQPIIPTLADSLLNKLGIPKSARYLENIRPLSWQKESDPNDIALHAEKLTLFKKIRT